MTIIPSAKKECGKDNFVPREGESPIQQLRYGASKDLWIHHPRGGRLHHHITSPRSILTIYNVGREVHFMEQMVSVKCYLQEKVEVENGRRIQQIRYIESPQGSYRYCDHYFNAQTLFIAFLRLPENTPLTELDLDNAPLIGEATEAFLYLLNGKIHLQSQRFKARIQHGQKMP